MRSASTSSDRIRAAAAAAAFELLVGCLLLYGLTVHMPPVGSRPKLFELVPIAPPPPEKIAPRRVRSRIEGSASPRNLAARAAQVVAPLPIIPVIIPPTISIAPLPGTGSALSAGASDIPGPGRAGGGEGIGTGDGGLREGDGGGGETPPRRIRGRLKDSDYPVAAGEAGVGGTVSVRFVVDTDGRVPECKVIASSGSALLDEVTCRLIEKRFRFAPSRDARGRPVRSQVIENHSWMIDQVPAPDPAGRNG